ncbi:nuclear transport factor 2 family protein [Patulibacter sp.]|uniref:nuclear transport factor 2 family protein n=1 Tax=Patulibacter sp. TaxID=1912859 RepID=UPI0027215CA2|nr:nuclear transport factor 2 family protein [Patulibacter sp.]MDO9410844.1 nuclear transport factor 2 family protein [Patulibacter sp.]
MTDPTDRLDVIDLMHRYATALDTRDWELLAEVFTEDGATDYGELGGINRGPDAIAALCRGALAGLDASQHLIGNVTCALDGDVGTASCYFQAQHVIAGADGGDHLLVGGSYTDELRRVDGRWRIALRTLTPTWSSGNPEIFRIGAERLAAAEPA